MLPPHVLSFIVKNWRYMAVAAAVIGAVAYGSYLLWQAKQEGRQECIQEVIIKEMAHVAEVKTKQNIAAAARPVNRSAVIERLRSHSF